MAALQKRARRLLYHSLFSEITLVLLAFSRDLKGIQDVKVDLPGAEPDQVTGQRVTNCCGEKGAA